MMTTVTKSEFFFMGSTIEKCVKLRFQCKRYFQLLKDYATAGIALFETFLKVFGSKLLKCASSAIVVSCNVQDIFDCCFTSKIRVFSELGILLDVSVSNEIYPNFTMKTIIRISTLQKSLLVLMLLLYASTSAKAQRPDGGNFGFGLIVGEPLGATVKVWTSSTTALV